MQGNNLNNNGGAEAVDPAVSARNHNIIIVGGRHAHRSDGVSKTAEIFNAAEGISTQLPPLNHARTASASCVYNGNVIVTGGFDGNDRTDSIEILKMRHRPLRWTMFDGKLPVKLSCHVVMLINCM